MHFLYFWLVVLPESGILLYPVFLGMQSNAPAEAAWVLREGVGSCGIRPVRTIFRHAFAWKQVGWCGFFHLIKGLHNEEPDVIAAPGRFFCPGPRCLGLSRAFRPGSLENGERSGGKTRRCHYHRRHGRAWGAFAASRHLLARPAHRSVAGGAKGL